MRFLDRVLQDWRFRLAEPWVRPGASILDVGCHQGEFFLRLGARIGFGVGFDPLARPQTTDRFRLLADPFPIPAPFPDASFDAVILLATLEHIGDKALFPHEFGRLLRPNGRVILTVPSPRIDRLVDVLRKLRIADGMSVEEHHGFLPQTVPSLFSREAFTLEHRQPFQFGLNNLFVFRKIDGPAPIEGTERAPVAEEALGITRDVP